MWKGERKRGKERQAKVEIQVRDIRGCPSLTSAAKIVIAQFVTR